MLLSALTFKQDLWGKWKSCSSVAGMNIVLFLMLITQTSGKAALLTFELEGDGVTGVTLSTSLSAPALWALPVPCCASQTNTANSCLPG